MYALGAIGIGIAVAVIAHSFHLCPARRHNFASEILTLDVDMPKHAVARGLFNLKGAWLADSQKAHELARRPGEGLVLFAPITPTQARTLDASQRDLLLWRRTPLPRPRATRKVSTLAPPASAPLTAHGEALFFESSK